MHLTVAIPTYNRNSVLCASLRHLLPQLTSQCCLLILDNHSDVPVEDSLRDLLSAYPHATVRVVRNRCNIGGAANILRCFELCDTQWLWLLGDDDHPASNAVSTILRNIQEHPSSVFLHFGSPAYAHSRSHATRGLREFVQSPVSWSHLNFMSVGVYHCPTVQPQLRLGHYFAYSCSPHPALLLASLGEDGCCWFSEEHLVAYQSPPEWPEVNALLGKMTLLELLPDEQVRRTFAAKLSWKPSLEAVAVILTKAGSSSRDRGQELYQYDQICTRLNYYNHSLLARLRAAAYRLLVRWPSIGYPVLRAIFPAAKTLLGYRHIELAQVACPSRFLRA